MSWDIALLYFFSWNFIWFLQKEPIKVQNFRFLTAQVKFHQICTSIGSFYWKYIKFQVKKYRGVISHDTEEWCKIWRKIDLFVSKMTRIWWILISALKSLKNWTLIDPFPIGRAKYITFDLKKYRGVIFHDTEESKFEEKLTCGLGNNMSNMENFHQSTRKSQN